MNIGPPYSWFEISMYVFVVSLFLIYRKLAS